MIPPELTLDSPLSPKILLPKSTAETLLEVSRLRNASDKISKLEDHANRLRAEMRKIEGFKRELPLCMTLVADAIATMEKEMIRWRSSVAQPIEEQLMPVKKTGTEEEEGADNSRDKMSWMSSVQLWNSGNNQHHHHPNINTKRKEELITPPAMDELFPSSKNRKIERAFEPLKGCGFLPVMNIGKEGRNEVSGVTELSLLAPEIKDSKEEIYTNGFSSKTSSSRSGSSSPTDQSIVKEQTTRKQRRCWSPQLHCQFVSALQRLGGPQVATPKQIRELMQVDGLTNDEVKSHLQKYRLHNRKATRLTNPSIDMGDLWVSQEHCGESSNPSNSQSGSPQGPFHLNGPSGVTSITSVEEEEEEERHIWKSNNSLSKRIDV